MADKEIDLKRRDLKANLAETAVRIRRYSLDPFLREPDRERDPDPGAKLRKQADDAWKEWLTVRERFDKLPAAPTLQELAEVERLWLQLDRNVDLIQRELISNESFVAGAKTVAWMAFALVLLAAIYLMTHGVRWFNFSGFEPWPEWGPAKYGEVAFWSSFGVLCSLLFLATRYLARRDFDRWYQPWYVSTALRGPFLTIILMVLVLEFGEWYGEGTWIENYLLEEGNKFYFIAFMSFCLGLASDSTSAIMRDLSDGVTEFVQRVVAKVSKRLSSAVSTTDSIQK